MQIERLRTHLIQALPRHLELLKSWVSVNSHTGNPAGVRRVADSTAAAFAPLGFTAESVQAPEPGCGEHLFLRRPGREASTLVFVSHLDTVYTTAEEEQNNFVWREEPSTDRIYGPGVGDIKGGTMMTLLVLEALAACAPDVFERFSLMVALNAAEERLVPSFSEILRTKLQTPVPAVLVFEGGSDWGDEWPLVVSRKGRLVFSVRITGRTAHSGVDFWSGKNAIVAATHVVNGLAALSDQAEEISVNVARIEGGTETNRVPHEAVIQGEVRMFADRLEEYADRIRQVAATCPLPAEADVTHLVPTWEENARTIALYDIWKDAGQSLGMNIVRQCRGGLSDGNFLWKDFPTIDGLGPTGGNYHRSLLCGETGQLPEYILHSSIIPKAILDCVAISNFVRGSIK